MKFLIRSAVIGAALWITTMLVDGVDVIPYEDTQLALIITYVLIGAIFGLVNGTLGVALKILAFPIYILTLGFFGMVVNGAMLVLSAWFTTIFEFGLTIESFWTGVWAAVVLSFFSWAIGLIVRPGK